MSWSVVSNSGVLWAVACWRKARIASLTRGISGTLRLESITHVTGVTGNSDDPAAIAGHLAPLATANQFLKQISSSS